MSRDWSQGLCDCFNDCTTCKCMTVKVGNGNSVVQVVLASVRIREKVAVPHLVKKTVRPFFIAIVDYAKKKKMLQLLFSPSR